LNVHFASEFLREVALEQARPESLMARRLDSRSATFLPLEGKHGGWLGGHGEAAVRSKLAPTGLGDC
jgi:hypothetical protein